MGSSFLLTAPDLVVFHGLDLLTGGLYPAALARSLAALWRRLSGFVFSFGYEKGAACWPRLYRWCSVVKLFPFLNYLLNS